ncbi:MlaD family protein [Nocardia sp. XZ_19_385]|uniref:MlaD family protein n=1 Tax=Nocardia sp. XZ_19_385 TaxID=2769488 RepID=UPI00188F425A|nr:MlaD family protein [Nocardia sp. XZ_19_385]
MAVFKDHSGRSVGRLGLRLRGAVVAVVGVLATVAITQYAQGGFEDSFELTIDAATIGEGLAPGAQVKFRGLEIGTVSGVEIGAPGRQRIGLRLDPEQARVLTDNVSARFASSNVFGSTAIELVTAGAGDPLRSGTTLTIGADSANATVTGVLRRAGQLLALVDSEQLERISDFLAESSDSIGPVTAQLLEFARMLADRQRSPISRYLHIGAENSDGLRQSAPALVALLGDIFDNSTYYADPVNRAHTRLAIGGLQHVVIEGVTDILGKHNPNLATVIDGVLDLLIPLAASIGSIAPAYNRIDELILNIGSAFPIVDGKPQLQVELSGGGTK